MNSEIMCLNLSAINDDIDEPLEQLELYFTNLPSSSAAAGIPATACVSIIDNDSEYMIVYSYCACQPPVMVEIDVALMRTCEVF